MPIDDQNRARKTYAANRNKPIPTAVGFVSGGYGINLSGDQNNLGISADSGVVTIGVTSTTTGSISIAFSGSVQAKSTTVLNISTEGTRDWFTPWGTAPAGRNYRSSQLQFGSPPSASHTCNSKIYGGQLQNSFTWILGNAFAVESLYFSNVNLTSDISDSVFGPISSTFTPGIESGFSPSEVGVLANTNVLNWGFAFNAPADTFSRTLRIYCSLHSVAMTLFVSSSDGSVIATDAQRDSGYTNSGDPSSTSGSKWTVTYNTAKDGQSLFVELLATKNYFPTDNSFIQLTAITLA